MAAHLTAWFAAFAIIPGCVALQWDDFTNNLATDLAPLITLFGEQVTKQFLSESLDIWDNIIFAMAPLGILTAVVSAIRIRGNPSLKAFIGRAQESPGTAEIELLSSTSDTTSELWNEGGIARVFGKPQILEIVKRESNHDDATAYQDDGDGDYEYTANIQPFADAARSDHENASWHRVGESTDAPDDEKALFGDSPSPNLSLNIGIHRPPRIYVYGSAILGVCLQSGVLIYAGFAYYQYPSHFLRDSSLGQSYGFPLTIVGTILVCFGMFLCAWIIERSTSETYYEQKPNIRSNLFWVQPGGQKLGDQVFGSFIGTSSSNMYVRSIQSIRKSAGVDVELWTAVTASMVGFVLQFIGLRAIHSSVTLVQLSATLLMALIRAGLRTQRMDKENNLVLARDPLGQLFLPPPPENHELDYLAMYFENIDTLELFRKQQGELSDQTVQPSPDGPGARAIKSRARLAHLTGSTKGLSWENLRVRDVTAQLQAAIEGVMEILSERISTAQQQDVVSTYHWPVRLDITGIENDAATRREDFSLRLRKGQGVTWKADAEVLEGILGLWALSLHNQIRLFTAWSKVENARLLAVDLTEDQAELKRAMTWYRVWIQRRSDAKPVTLRSNGKYWYRSIELEISNVRYVLGPCSARDFGSLSTAEPVPGSAAARAGGLLVQTKHSTLTMCAQDLFIAFFAAVLTKVDDIGGITEKRVEVGRRNEFLLQNTQIELMVNKFEESGLGSREDAYMCIIPILMRKKNSLGTGSTEAMARKAVDSYIQTSDYGEARQLLKWICDNPGLADPQECYGMLGELFHVQLRHQDHAIRTSGFLGIKEMLATHNTGPIRPISLRYGWIGMRIAEELKGNSPTHFFIQQLQDLDEESQKLLSDIRKLVGNEAPLSDVHYWAKENNITVLTYLARKPGEQLDQLDFNDRTPLSWAAQFGGIETVKLLLEHNADPQTTNNDGRTPLMYAAEHGWHTIVAILLTADSSVVNIRSRGEGKTALMLAAEKGHQDCIKTILAEPFLTLDARDAEWSSALACAVIGGHIAAVKLLLQTNIDVDAMDLKNHTALHRAAARGSTDIARDLIAKGASIEVGDRLQKTPLHYSARKGHYETTKLLLERGANVEVKGGNFLPARMHEGITPLDEAVQNEHKEIMTLLLERKAKPTSTTLYWAIAKRHVDMVDILLKHGVSANERMFSTTMPEQFSPTKALHLAVFMAAPEVVSKLLENGADVNGKNDEGETPMHSLSRHWKWDAIPEEHVRQNVLEVAGLLLGRMAEQFTADPATAHSESVQTNIRKLALRLVNADGTARRDINERVSMVHSSLRETVRTAIRVRRDS